MSTYARNETGINVAGSVEPRVFEPARLGALRLSNRLVMAPMTRSRAAADGVPQEMMATHYAQRASAGPIIAEASTPNAVGQSYPNTIAIYNDDAHEQREFR